MDFKQRLEKAIHRGERRSEAKAREAKEKALTKEEFKSLHSRFQLQLSEYIEQCVGQLPNHFPGFQFETIYGEKGWGAACRRDDIEAKGGKRSNFYSRLEITIRPFSTAHVLELSAKGTVRNKETFNRKHFEKLGDVDSDAFVEMIDLWILEFAELFAAQS